MQGKEFTAEVAEVAEAKTEDLRALVERLVLAGDFARGGMNGGMNILVR